MTMLHHVHLKDAMELDQLISHLINKEDSEGAVLLGHSTGCQVSSGCIIN
jgi:pimeloyl-ACP methyl ester carboxylesterase